MWIVEFDDNFRSNLSEVGGANGQHVETRMNQNCLQVELPFMLQLAINANTTDWCIRRIYRLRQKHVQKIYILSVLWREQ